jgi:hypothetical protein
MKKQTLKIVILALVAIVCLGMVLLWSNNTSAGKNHMSTLSTADTLYIPSHDDCEYYFSDSQATPPMLYDRFRPQIEAMYELRNASEKDIRTMMNDPSVNLNIVGYVLYLRNLHRDIAFEYVLEWLERDDTVFLVAYGQLIWGRYRVGSVMLWIALGGLDSPKILQPTFYWAYHAFGLTDEQLAILKAKYEANPEPDTYFDEYLRTFFEPETRRDLQKSLPVPLK